MSDYKYVYPESNHSFWVYSPEKEIDYLVSLVKPNDLNKAKQIVEEIITRWMKKAYMDNPYWYKKFVRKAKEALEDEDIDAMIYVRAEEVVM